MKRIIAIMLLMILVASFCGCTQKAQPETEDNSPIVIIPDYATKATVNGYKQFTSNETKENKPAEENKISNEYYANKSTKKFHLNSCSYAENIKSENLYISKSRDELIGNGYEPCKKCNP